MDAIKDTFDINDLDHATIEVDGVDPKDYPDFCDAYVSYACWKNGQELTDLELDQLNDSHSDIAQELAFETLI
jgi:hypothetical protein